MPCSNFEQPIWTSDVAWRRYKGLTHDHLRVFEVRGSGCGAGLVEFLAFVFQNASSLENMVDIDGEFMIGNGLNSLKAIVLAKLV